MTKFTRKIVLWLNVILLFLFLLLALDLDESYDLHGKLTKKLVYIGSSLGSIGLIVANLIFVRKSNVFLFALIFPILSLCILKKNYSLSFLLSASSWHTQSIEYVSKKDASWRIEFQMQDAGILGYKKRIVAVKHVLPWLMKIEPIRQPVDTALWRKDYQSISELKWLN